MDEEKIKASLNLLIVYLNNKEVLSDEEFGNISRLINLYRRIDCWNGELILKRNESLYKENTIIKGKKPC